MSETLVDPSLVSVVVIVSSDGQAMKSPQTIAKDKQKKKHSTPVKKSSTTDAKLELMDQKWSELFGCLEALFLSKFLEKSDETFQTVKMPISSQACGTECFTYHVELNALLGWPQAIGQRPRKMDEIMMTRCLSTVGEYRSEIRAPHLFLLVRIVLTCILLRGKDLIFYMDILFVGY